MTEKADEVTAVIPPVEAPVIAEEAVAAPAAPYQPVAPAASGWQHTPKVMIIVAATLLGIAVLAGTFASGFFVGAHVAGGPGRVFAEQGFVGGRGAGPGAGMGGREGRGMMRQRGGQFRGRGGFGQGVPQNPGGSQLPTAPGVPGGRW